ncbi:hypothetical protein GQR58_000862 [Nymphon striatum]|nr:hypothetical protein GQR58_000862 [Nymphon striatum]
MATNPIDSHDDQHDIDDRGRLPTHLLELFLVAKEAIYDWMPFLTSTSGTYKYRTQVVCSGCILLLVDISIPMVHGAALGNDMSGMKFPHRYNLPPGAKDILADIKETFRCEGRSYGYYADTDNNCQIYHVCNPIKDWSGKVVSMQHYSFICNTGTVFSQLTRTCTWPHVAPPCGNSKDHFDINDDFGKVEPKIEHRSDRKSKVMDFKPPKEERELDGDDSSKHELTTSYPDLDIRTGDGETTSTTESVDIVDDRAMNSSDSLENLLSTTGVYETITEIQSNSTIDNDGDLGFLNVTDMTGNNNETDTESKDSSTDATELENNGEFMNSSDSSEILPSTTEEHESTTESLPNSTTDNGEDLRFRNDTDMTGNNNETGTEYKESSTEVEENEDGNTISTETSTTLFDSEESNETTTDGIDFNLEKINGSVMVDVDSLKNGVDVITNFGTLNGTISVDFGVVDNKSLEVDLRNNADEIVVEVGDTDASNSSFSIDIELNNESVAFNIDEEDSMDSSLKKTDSKLINSTNIHFEKNNEMISTESSTTSPDSDEKIEPTNDDLDINLEETNVSVNVDADENVETDGLSISTHFGKINGSISIDFEDVDNTTLNVEFGNENESVTFGVDKDLLDKSLEEIDQKSSNSRDFEENTKISTESSSIFFNSEKANETADDLDIDLGEINGSINVDGDGLISTDFGKTNGTISFGFEDIDSRSLEVNLRNSTDEINVENEDTNASNSSLNINIGIKNKSAVFDNDNKGSIDRTFNTTDEKLSDSTVVEENNDTVSTESITKSSDSKEAGEDLDINLEETNVSVNVDADEDFVTNGLNINTDLRKMNGSISIDFEDVDSRSLNGVFVNDTNEIHSEIDDTHKANSSFSVHLGIKNESVAFGANKDSLDLNFEEINGNIAVDSNVDADADFVTDGLSINTDLRKMNRSISIDFEDVDSRSLNSVFVNDTDEIHSEIDDTHKANSSFSIHLGIKNESVAFSANKDSLDLNLEEINGNISVDSNVDADEDFVTDGLNINTDLRKMNGSISIDFEDTDSRSLNGVFVNDTDEIHSEIDDTHKANSSFSIHLGIKDKSVAFGVNKDSLDLNLEEINGNISVDSNVDADEDFVTDGLNINTDLRKMNGSISIDFEDVDSRFLNGHTPWNQNESIAFGVNKDSLDLNLEEINGNIAVDSNVDADEDFVTDGLNINTDLRKMNGSISIDFEDVDSRSLNDVFVNDTDEIHSEIDDTHKANSSFSIHLGIKNESVAFEIDDAHIANSSFSIHLGIKNESIAFGVNKDSLDLNLEEINGNIAVDSNVDADEDFVTDGLNINTDLRKMNGSISIDFEDVDSRSLNGVFVNDTDEIHSEIDDTHKANSSFSIHLGIKNESVAFDANKDSLDLNLEEINGNIAVDSNVDADEDFVTDGLNINTDLRKMNGSISIDFEDVDSRSLNDVFVNDTDEIHSEIDDTHKANSSFSIHLGIKNESVAFGVNKDSLDLNLEEINRNISVDSNVDADEDFVTDGLSINTDFRKMNGSISIDFEDVDSRSLNGVFVNDTDEIHSEIDDTHKANSSFSIHLGIKNESVAFGVNKDSLDLNLEEINENIAVDSKDNVSIDISLKDVNNTLNMDAGEFDDFNMEEISETSSGIDNKSIISMNLGELNDTIVVDINESDNSSNSVDINLEKANATISVDFGDVEGKSSTVDFVNNFDVINDTHVDKSSFSINHGSETVSVEVGTTPGTFSLEDISENSFKIDDDSISTSLRESNDTAALNIDTSDTSTTSIDINLEKSKEVISVDSFKTNGTIDVNVDKSSIDLGKINGSVNIRTEDGRLISFNQEDTNVNFDVSNFDSENDQNITIHLGKSSGTVSVDIDEMISSSINTDLGNDNGTISVSLGEISAADIDESSFDTNFGDINGNFTIGTVYVGLNLEETNETVHVDFGISDNVKGKAKTIDGDEHGQDINIGKLDGTVSFDIDEDDYARSSINIGLRNENQTTNVSLSENSIGNDNGTISVSLGEISAVDIDKSSFDTNFGGINGSFTIGTVYVGLNRDEINETVHVDFGISDNVKGKSKTIDGDEHGQDINKGKLDGTVSFDIDEGDYASSSINIGLGNENGTTHVSLSENSIGNDNGTISVSLGEISAVDINESSFDTNFGDINGNFTIGTVYVGLNLEEINETVHVDFGISDNVKGKSKTIDGDEHGQDINIEPLDGTTSFDIDEGDDASSSINVDLGNENGTINVSLGESSAVDIDKDIINTNINVEIEESSFDTNFGDINGSFTIRTVDGRSIRLNREEINETVHVDFGISDDVKGKTTTINGDENGQDINIDKLDGTVSFDVDGGDDASSTINIDLGNENGTINVSLGASSAADNHTDMINTAINVDIDESSFDTSFGDINSNFTIGTIDGRSAGLNREEINETVHVDFGISDDVKGKTTINGDENGQDIIINKLDGTVSFDVDESDDTSSSMNIDLGNENGNINVSLGASSAVHIVKDMLKTTINVDIDESSFDTNFRDTNGSFTTGTVDGRFVGLDREEINGTVHVDLGISDDVKGKTTTIDGDENGQDINIKKLDGTVSFDMEESDDASSSINIDLSKVNGTIDLSTIGGNNVGISTDMTSGNGDIDIDIDINKTLIDSNFEESNGSIVVEEASTSFNFEEANEARNFDTKISDMTSHNTEKVSGTEIVTADINNSDELRSSIDINLGKIDGTVDVNLIEENIIHNTSETNGTVDVNVEEFSLNNISAETGGGFKASDDVNNTFNADANILDGTSFNFNFTSDSSIKINLENDNSSIITDTDEIGSESVNFDFGEINGTISSDSIGSRSFDINQTKATVDVEIFNDFKDEFSSNNVSNINEPFNISGSVDVDFRETNNTLFRDIINASHNESENNIFEEVNETFSYDIDTSTGSSLTLNTKEINGNIGIGVSDDKQLNVRVGKSKGIIIDLDKNKHSFKDVINLKENNGTISIDVVESDNPSVKIDLNDKTIYSVIDSEDGSEISFSTKSASVGGTKDFSKIDDGSDQFNFEDVSKVTDHIIGSKTASVDFDLYKMNSTADNEQYNISLEEVNAEEINGTDEFEDVTLKINIDGSNEILHAYESDKRAIDIGFEESNKTDDRNISDFNFGEINGTADFESDNIASDIEDKDNFTISEPSNRSVNIDLGQLGKAMQIDIQQVDTSEHDSSLDIAFTGSSSRISKDAKQHSLNVNFGKNKRIVIDETTENENNFIESYGDTNQTNKANELENDSESSNHEVNGTVNLNGSVSVKNAKSSRGTFDSAGYSGNMDSELLSMGEETIRFKNSTFTDEIDSSDFDGSLDEDAVSIATDTNVTSDSFEESGNFSSDVDSITKRKENSFDRSTDSSNNLANPGNSRRGPGSIHVEETDPISPVDRSANENGAKDSNLFKIDFSGSGDTSITNENKDDVLVIESIGAISDKSNDQNISGVEYNLDGGNVLKIDNEKDEVRKEIHEINKDKTELNDVNQGDKNSLEFNVIGATSEVVKDFNEKDGFVNLGITESPSKEIIDAVNIKVTGIDGDRIDELSEDVSIFTKDSDKYGLESLNVDAENLNLVVIKSIDNQAVSNDELLISEDARGGRTFTVEEHSDSVVVKSDGNQSNFDRTDDSDSTVITSEFSYNFTATTDENGEDMAGGSNDTEDIELTGHVEKFEIEDSKTNATEIDEVMMADGEFNQTDFYNSTEEMNLTQVEHFDFDFDESLGEFEFGNATRNETDDEVLDIERELNESYAVSPEEEAALIPDEIPNNEGVGRDSKQILINDTISFTIENNNISLSNDSESTDTDVKTESEVISDEKDSGIVRMIMKGLEKLGFISGPRRSSNARSESFKKVKVVSNETVYLEGEINDSINSSTSPQDLDPKHESVIGTNPKIIAWKVDSLREKSQLNSENTTNEPLKITMVEFFEFDSKDSRTNHEMILKAYIRGSGSINKSSLVYPFSSHKNKDVPLVRSYQRRKQVSRAGEHPGKRTSRRYVGASTNGNDPKARSLELGDYDRKSENAWVQNFRKEVQTDEKYSDLSKIVQPKFVQRAFGDHGDNGRSKIIESEFDNRVGNLGQVTVGTDDEYDRENNNQQPGSSAKSRRK